MASEITQQRSHHTAVHNLLRSASDSLVRTEHRAEALLRETAQSAGHFKRAGISAASGARYAVLGGSNTALLLAMELQFKDIFLNLFSKLNVQPVTVALLGFAATIMYPINSYIINKGISLKDHLLESTLVASWSMVSTGLLGLFQNVPQFIKSDPNLGPLVNIAIGGVEVAFSFYIVKGLVYASQ